MAKLTITRDTERRVAAILAGTSDPAEAAVRVLSFLRHDEERQAKARLPDIDAEIVEGRNVYHALRFINRAIDKKSRTNVLRYMHIRCDGHVLTLTGTNLEKWYVAEIAAEGHPEIDVLIPHYEVYKTLQSLKGARIQFDVETEAVMSDLWEVDDDGNHVETETKTEVRTVTIYADGNPVLSHVADVPVSEFPLAPNIGDAVFSATLPEALAKHLPNFVFGKVSHPILQQVVVKPNGMVAAADGFRLFADYLPEGPDGNEVMIHGDALSDADTYIEGDQVVSWHEVETSDDTWNRDYMYSVTRGRGRYGASYTLYHHIKQGNFPDVNRSIPTQSKIKMRVVTDDLLDGLKLVAPIAKNTANICRMHVFETFAELSSDSDGGRLGSEIKVQCRTEFQAPQNFLAAYNVTFLQFVAKAFADLGADELLLEFIKPTAPLKITASDLSSGVTAVGVVMPMHLGVR